MSDIKRYDPMEIGWSGGEMLGSMKMAVDGDYVSYEDHLAAMEALRDDPPKYAKETFGSMGRHLNDLEKRTKALEENPLENHMALIGEPKTLLMHKPVGVLLQALVDPLKKRLEALEKALNEHMVKEREEKFRRTWPAKVDEMFDKDMKKRRAPLCDMALTATLNGNEDYIIKIDPKASPTGIPFEVALAYAKAGRKITRNWWHQGIDNGPDGKSDGAYLFASGNTIMLHDVAPSHNRVWNATGVDLLATDWMVVPQV